MKKRYLIINIVLLVLTAAAGWEFLNYRPARLKNAAERNAAKPPPPRRKGLGKPFRPMVRPASIILGDLFNPNRGGPVKGPGASRNMPFELVGTFRCGRDAWAVIREKIPGMGNKPTGRAPTWQQRYAPPPGRNNMNRAGIANKAKKTPASKLYKINDKLPHGYILKKIEGDHVVLQVPGGSSLTLKVKRGAPKPPSKGTRVKAPTAQKKATPQPAAKPTPNQKIRK
ncbi:hypothetical protein P0136_01675 [Lentisphaerota bacterium ZTH]|nr:hypothetical protein JYG24_07185 [Lentisphaerota bacterium]WET06722.1 hypothetical protein P0136_01675 [Lentisphaerota bacterium ZTH]